MKKLFLSGLVLFCLVPINLTWGIDAYGTIESGAFFTAGGPTDYTATATMTQSLKADTASDYRLSAFQTAHYVTADSTLEAVAIGTQVEKYVTLFGIDFGIAPKVGMFTDISDGKNSSNPLLGLRFTGYLLDWVGISLGADQIFQDGGNNTSIVGGITLTPSLK